MHRAFALDVRRCEADALCLAGDVASTGGAEDTKGYYREAHHRDDDVPRHEHALLGGAGGG